jgi:hypothetical protein
MAYRRQRLSEVAEVRDRDRAALEQQRARDDLTRVFNERFGAASAQLGHDEPAVRLAGAYAIAGLGRPAETVRGWLRRFSSRAEQLRAAFTTLLVAFLADPGVLPADAGTPLRNALAAIIALARAAGVDVVPGDLPERGVAGADVVEEGPEGRGAGW